ncbi:putative glycosyl transferase [compost metagenome]|uniref:Glycosyltransferase n=1 Tax=Pseudomonas putida TaxID=303 RepID=A0A7D5VZA0_PSEPU|nr:glycosyltransferase [Pseudomonas putida]QLJ15611.1 glycosyltransferase [Pseudomonas putida]
MSDNRPQVAVLLAAYNGINWIEEQVVSILAQAHVDVSIYISIDSSSDGTEAWCSECARKHANVHVLPPAGPFGGAAPNFFRLIRDVDVSAFDYISFADQDDVWYPDKLDRAVSKLRSDEIDGYSSNVVAFWSSGRRVLVNKAQPQVKWDYFFEAAGPGCTYVLTQRLARAFQSAVNEHWSKVQSVMLHDWLCYAYARSAGFKWYIDPVPGMDYRQHANNQVGVNAGVASAISRVRQVWQGWWFAQVRLICELTASENSQNTVAKILARPGRFSLFRLIMHASECRRRSRDQLVFAAFCGLSAFRR